MDVSGQLHTLDTLPPGKIHVFIGLEAGWAPGLIWRNEKSIAPASNWTPAIQLIAILTVLPHLWLQKKYGNKIILWYYQNKFVHTNVIKNKNNNK
jgi:hypothetical protein